MAEDIMLTPEEMEPILQKYPFNIFSKMLEAQIDKMLKLGYIQVAEAAARPKIICLCGSSRFVAEMAVIAWTMEKEGAITLGLHLLPAGYTDVEDHIAEAEGVAEKMDVLHLRKIDLADEVFVLNVGGYIGNSTRNEIEYAASIGKTIKYLEPNTTP